MEITSLQIKNFMSIQDVELKCGQVNLITGGNTNGKTTILKAIETAAKGSTDGKLVKFGEERAEIIVELPDETRIRRTISSAGKGSVSVRKGDFSVSSPQTYLENLFNFSAFNPLELLEPKRRTESIMKSIDLKLTPEIVAEKLGVPVEKLPHVEFNQHGLKVLTDLHKLYFSRRAEANKDALDKKNRFEAFSKDQKQVEKPKATRIEINAKKEALNQKLNKISVEHGKAAEANRAINEEREKLVKWGKELEQIDKDIVELEKSLATARSRREQGQKLIDELVTKLEKNPAADLSGFETQKQQVETEKQALIAAEKEIDAYEAVQKSVEMVESMKAEYDKAQKFADDLDKAVTLLAGDLKKDLMATADMPIKGLEYKDEAFYLNGIPVDNLSTSQILVFSVAVARKLSKKTKVICIDGAECLDEESFKALLAEIKDDGFTYFITRVGHTEATEGVNNITMAKGAMQ